MRLASPMPETRGEKYDWYFNQLTDELTRQAYPYAENWYRWRPGANSCIYRINRNLGGYRVWFPGPRYRDISVALGLAIDFKSEQVCKLLFEILKERRAEIEEKIGYELDWDRYLDIRFRLGVLAVIRFAIFQRATWKKSEIGMSKIYSLLSRSLRMK